MKKTILFSIFILSASTIFAQSAKPERIVKLDPFALFVSTLGVRFEQVMTGQYSIQVGGSYTTQAVTMWEGLEGRANGYTINMQLRRYFLPGYESVGRVAPEGVYIGAWGKYEHLNATLRIGDDKADMMNGSAYSGGLMAGCQFWIKYKRRNLLLFDAFMGGGYKIADYAGRFAEKGRLIQYARSGIVPRFVVSVGMPI
ncbi:MAG: autotransporter outer membrane beta-barrel domain-containing protein [Bacteroidota bacterium]